MREEKVAIIDMGTNTFHLLLASWNGKDATIFCRERTAVKLGQGGITRGYIAEDAYHRALDALASFRSMIDLHGISRIYATATSAVRNASNGKALVNDILTKTGIQVQVIAGEKEADLIYKGVKLALDLGTKPSLIMDIGGGSVEFILCDAKKVFWKGSFEIGAQRLVDQFHSSDPISAQEIKKLTNYLDEKLAALFEVASSYRPLTLIGSSGSFDTLCEIDIREQGLSVDIEHEKEYSISLEAFEKMYVEIITKNKQQRLQIPGMIEMRAEMIVVACILTAHIVKRLSASSIRVSTYALKEGMLCELLGM